VPAVRAVPTQACGIVIAMIAVAAVNKTVILSVTNRFYRVASTRSEKNFTIL
jgi:hypothetical protein